MQKIEDFASERADISFWSTPLIADCIEAAYRACLGNDDRLVRHFTDQHRRLWQSLVRDDRTKVSERQTTLNALAKMCRLTAEALQAIDEIVLDELADVVALRYQGSPAKTRSYNRILIDAASVLTQTRLAA